MPEISGVFDPNARKRTKTSDWPQGYSETNYEQRQAWERIQAEKAATRRSSRMQWLNGRGAPGSPGATAAEGNRYGRDRDRAAVSLGVRNYRPTAPGWDCPGETGSRSSIRTSPSAPGLFSSDTAATT
jgi:hypothetical protein